jgi:hypothetical protein
MSNNFRGKKLRNNSALLPQGVAVVPFIPISQKIIVQ